MADNNKRGGDRSPEQRPRTPSREKKSDGVPFSNQPIPKPKAPGPGTGTGDAGPNKDVPRKS